MDWSIQPSLRVCQERQITLSVPGDKSISHRAVILASIADGTSSIEGFLDGSDTQATVNIMRQLGVPITQHSPTSLQVHGVGLHGLQAPHDELDCGNAGTAMRLLAGLLSAQSFSSTLTGDASLCKRPMQRILQPLRRMGAQIDSSADGRPPLRIAATSSLQSSVTHRPEIASAQVKSAVLLAGLYADGVTRVNEITPTRDYTEQMLRMMGWPIEFGHAYAQVEGGAQLNAVNLQIPGDFSSAAFVIVAAIISANVQVRIRNVGVSARRTGLLKALQLMGGDIAVENERESYAGPVADIVVRSSQLHAIHLPREWVADMIDEIPVFCIAATQASGVTRIRGAEELRVKESDRLNAMGTNLEKLGVRLTPFHDGMEITGQCALRGGELHAFDDHRVAMSLAVLAGALSTPTHIQGVDNVLTSFPRFTQTMSQLGYVIRAQ